MDNVKVGIAIPCHVRDEPYLERCLGSIANLNPQPSKILINKNHGENSMKQIRTKLYDRLFESCDVILQCCADYYLFPDILRHIHPKKVTSFNRLNRGLTDVPRMFLHIALKIKSGRNWTGCYSLPVHEWKQIREDPRWDGTDVSVHRIIQDYKFVFSPKLWLQKRSDNRLQDFLGETLSFRKIRNLLFRAVI